MHSNTHGFKEEIYYKTENKRVPDLNKKIPSVQRIVRTVNYKSTKAKWKGFAESQNFAVRWSGLLTATKPGTYRFEIESDDGSNLYINKKKVVDNDGMHGMTKVPGTVSLRPTQLIILTYFEKGGAGGMILKYMGPDTRMKMIVVPRKAMKAAFFPVRTPAPPRKKKKKATRKKATVAR